jgi:hypothetical protein
VAGPRGCTGKCVCLAGCAEKCDGVAGCAVKCDGLAVGRARLDNHQGWSVGGQAAKLSA